MSLMFSGEGRLVFAARQNVSNLTFFMRETFSRLSNQAGEKSQFASCPVLTETPIKPF